MLGLAAEQWHICAPRWQANMPRLWIPTQQPLWLHQLLILLLRSVVMHDDKVLITSQGGKKETKQAFFINDSKKKKTPTNLFFVFFWHHHFVSGKHVAWVQQRHWSVLCCFYEHKGCFERTHCAAMSGLIESITVWIHWWQQCFQLDPYMACANRCMWQISRYYSRQPYWSIVVELI